MNLNLFQSGMMFQVPILKRVLYFAAGFVFMHAVLAGGLYAQNTAIEKVNQLNALALKNVRKLDSMVMYANEAYLLAKQNKYPFGEGIALKFKGIYENEKSRFQQAIQYYTESLEIFVALGNDLEQGKANLNIATAYRELHDYQNSVRYGLKALALFEKLKDPNGKGRVLNLLGIVSFVQKDYQAAKRYFISYSNLAAMARDTAELGSSANNIGQAYLLLKMSDSAMFHLKRAIRFHEAIKNPGGLSQPYENIGVLYSERRDYKTAMDYFRKSMDANIRMGNEKSLSHSYFLMGRTYLHLKDTTNALSWVNKGKELAIKVGDKEIVQECYKLLARLEAGDDNFKKAYENLQLSVAAKDSIMNVSKAGIIEDLKTRYETEKKEQQIKLLKQQADIQELKIRQRNIFLGVSGTLLLVLITFSYLYFSRQKIQEQARLQVAINKEQEITAKEVLNAEERERRRIATDLHDGVGQLLSAALMNLNGLFKKAKFEKDEEILAENSLSLVTESYDEMRSISHQIIPNALLKAGLASAIKEFLNKLDESRIKVNLETVGIHTRLDEQTETVLYRVVQETVNNVIKHAQATKLSIQLVKDEDGISLSIEDNGIGFDATRLGDKSGIGLRNIQSRVAFLKGSIDFDSKPGKGTLVAIHIPS